jgi:hypothetical protein
LSHMSSLFCDRFFEIRSHELFVWGLLQTVILLISAFGVARIIGVSSWHAAQNSKYLECDMWVYRKFEISEHFGFQIQRCTICTIHVAFKSHLTSGLRLFSGKL